MIDLAWPMWSSPFGSGGKRVTTRPPYLPGGAVTGDHVANEVLGGEEGEMSFKAEILGSLNSRER